MISYGGILRELRKSKKISQRELSRRTGVACSTISRIEGDIIIPRIDTYSKLMKELKR